MPEPSPTNTPAHTMNVLVVDGELPTRRSIAAALESKGHRVVGVSNTADALHEAQHRSFDLAFVDLRLGENTPAEKALDLIPKLLAHSPWTKVVMVTAYASVENAVEAMKRGASDYLPKPFTPAEVHAVTQRFANARKLKSLADGLTAAVGTMDLELDSASPAMQRTIALARQIAGSDVTVMIRGESGTGKGVLARMIHGWSPRSGKAFGVIACPSLSPELLESELFGHVRGAFTTAVRDNPGRISACDGGTLMLDEIGDLPLAVQPKLLRFIQDREYERVGEAITRRADLRLITATHVNLESRVHQKMFREDLFYRLNVITLDLPALRERLEDILPLAHRFLTFFRRGAQPLLGFTQDAKDALLRYPWPGNIRELRNVIERAAVLATGEHVTAAQLPIHISPRATDPVLGDLVTLDKIEEVHIRRVLANTRSLEEAAAVLGIDLATLWRRRKRYGL